MIHLSEEKQLAVLAGLVEGNSERAVERMTGVNRQTVGRFGLRFGEGARRLHNRLVRDLTCSKLALDEIWAFCGAKKKNVKPSHGPDAGEQWVWVAIDQSSRLVVSFHVGRRDQKSADTLALDLRSRLLTMPELIVSDGLEAYKAALLAALGMGITYGQMIKHAKRRKKVNGDEDEDENDELDPDYRYAQEGKIDFIERKAIFGNPDLDQVTTYAIERNNLTMRHHIGRIRRLCLAFSKKLENFAAAAALNYAHYNLCLISKPLRTSPAIAAGVTRHLWDLPEFLAAIMAEPPAPKAVPAPLKPLEYPFKDISNRNLPEGRGFLEAIPGGRGVQRPSPSSARASTPTATPVAPTMPSSAPTPASASSAKAAPAAPLSPPKQLELFSWRRPMRQIDLFTRKLDDGSSP